MTTHVGKLKDAAVEKKILVSYLLLMNTVIGLDKQEKEFEKSNGKLTKSRKKAKSKRNELPSTGYQVVLFFG